MKILEYFIKTENYKDNLSNWNNWNIENDYDNLEIEKFLSDIFL